MPDVEVVEHLLLLAVRERDDDPGRVVSTGLTVHPVVQRGVRERRTDVLPKGEVQDVRGRRLFRRAAGSPHEIQGREDPGVRVDREGEIMPLLARDFDSERRLGDRVEVLDLRRAVRDRHGRSGRGDVRSVRDLDDRGPGEVVRVARLRRRGRRPLRFERPVAREVPPELCASADNPTQQWLRPPITQADTKTLPPPPTQPAGAVSPSPPGLPFLSLFILSATVYPVLFAPSIIIRNVRWNCRLNVDP